MSWPVVANSGILDIAPYVGGGSSVAGAAAVVKFSSNEGALGPSRKAVEAYRAVGRDIFRYPDGGATRLRAAIRDRAFMIAVRDHTRLWRGKPTAALEACGLPRSLRVTIGTEAETTAPIDAVAAFRNRNP